MKTTRTEKILRDAPVAAEAVQAVIRAVESGDQDALAQAAKILEAFGCYARRTEVEPQLTESELFPEPHGG